MSRKPGSASLDMTQGSTMSLIIRFSLPLLAGNALQQLYNMVDSMVVGQFVGKTALVGVGSAFPVVFLLSSLFMGLGSGAMVMVSQYFGGGERENLRKTVDSLYTGLIVGAIPLSVLGIVLADPILSLLSVPDDARGEAYLYLVILLGGLIGGLGYNMNAGLLQGIGDSRTPLLFLVVACGINIALDLFLVLVIPLGVAGVAIATVFAQLFSWVFGIFYINRKYPDLRIHPFRFRFDKKIFARIMRMGIPAGIQQALFSFGIMMMTRLINDFGSTYAAGFNAANKLDAFAFLPIQSISTALITYTGQNIGAGKLHRVDKGVKSSLLLCLGIAVAGLLVIPAGPWLLRIFTPEADVVVAGMAYLTRIMPFYTLLAVMFVVNSAMRGAGEAIIPMLSSVVGLWLARVPSAYLLVYLLGGRDNLYFCYGIGWILALIFTIPVFLMGKWKNKALTRAGTTAKNAPPAIEASSDNEPFTA